MQQQAKYYRKWEKNIKTQEKQKQQIKFKFKKKINQDLKLKTDASGNLCLP